MKKCTLLLVILIGLVFATIDLSYAQIDQSKLISSGERVVSIWVSHLKDGFDLLKKEEENNSQDGENYYYWKIRRLTLIDTPSYDIRKTDSIVSPYNLIINFNVKYEDNTSGPNVNGHYSKSLKHTYGYKSAEDAMKYTNPEDFEDLNPIFKSSTGDNTMSLSVYYAFQNNKWIFKGGSDLLESNPYEIKETDSFKKLLSDVPME